LDIAIGDRMLLHDASFALERGEHVALVGPNGSGKTTLLETILGRREAASGRVGLGHGVEVAYFSQQEMELDTRGSVLMCVQTMTGLSRPDAQNLLGKFLFSGWDEHEKPVAVLSGGERRRLALAVTVASGANLLVLDEPTNHLDLAAREQLEAVLADYEGTLVFVSHDRYFIDKLASELWLINGGLLRRFEGGWTAYQRERAAGRDASVVEYVDASERRRAGDAASLGLRERESGPRQQGKVASSEEGASSERAKTPSRGRTRPPTRSRATASPLRRVGGTRALEARIAAMELQLKQLTEKVAQIAQSGNYLETRRIGEEHAALEKALRELYDEWAKVSEAEKE